MDNEQLSLDFEPGGETGKAEPATVSGIASGFPDLDRLTGGFHAGQFVVVAAAPAVGKTSFLLNIAHHLALAKRDAFAFFSLEIEKEQFASRLLSIGTMGTDPETRKVRGVGFASSYAGDYADWQWQLLQESFDLLCVAPMYVELTYPLGIESLADKAQQLAERRNVKVIFIDYLQLLSGNLGVLCHHTHIRPVAAALKDLAEELQLTVIATSQVSRRIYAYIDHQPKLTDLRGRTAITDYADVVLLIHRPPIDPAVFSDPDRRYDQRFHDVNLIVAKNSHGNTGRIPMWFYPEITRFLPACADEGGGIDPDLCIRLCG